MRIGLEGFSRWRDEHRAGVASRKHAPGLSVSFSDSIHRQADRNVYGNTARAVNRGQEIGERLMNRHADGLAIVQRRRHPSVFAAIGPDHEHRPILTSGAGVGQPEWGALYYEPIELDPGRRTPCAECGSQSRAFSKHLSGSVQMHSSLTAKGKHAGATGRRKWFIETFSGADWSYRLRRFIRKQRTIDRDNDRYAEKVVDPENGEVLHNIEEPLSEHWGHSSAKPKDG